MLERAIKEQGLKLKIDGAILPRAVLGRKYRIQRYTSVRDWIVILIAIQFLGAF
jgi:hypothetical protein